MSIVYPEHILLTGAGFTKNFGGLLAKEMWSKIFNHSQAVNFPRIKELLCNDLDYESIYHKIINGNFSDSKKTFINDAIFTAYKSLDEICTEWIYRKDAPYPVNIYGVNKLIERFYDSSKNIGFLAHPAEAYFGLSKMKKSGHTGPF